MKVTKNISLKRLALVMFIISIVLVTVSCTAKEEKDQVEEVDLETKKDNVEVDSEEEPTKLTRITVDPNGLDSEGRIVAYFASPLIDEEVDEVWDVGEEVTPQFVSGDIDTSATFKIVWDDNSLYVLAKVLDSELSVASDTPYMQDSIEIFLDEHNDKTLDYGQDDLHLRVNYENLRTADSGSLDGFYTNASKDHNGYTIALRVPLQNKHSNGDVLGLELQVNDAKGTNRSGTLNVFDSTDSAWSDTSKFGEVILTGKADDRESGINPYDLLSLIDNSRNMDLSMYKNAEVLDDAISQIEEVLKKDGISQEEIDEQYDYLNNAIDKLDLSDEAANEKNFQVLPSEYRSLNEEQGSIETLEYTTDNLSDGKDNKKLHVYLPYGYNESDTSIKYNVLYLMHGGGENEDLLFGGPGQNKELKKIIDNMIAKGEIEPLIVVTPTFNRGKNDATLFYDELMKDVIPLVETKYNTFVDSADLDDLKATRQHRAFGGFSMGSVATWSTYINCIDYIKYYIPLCGDAWVLGQTAGESKAAATAEYLANVAKEAGYSPLDYYLFCATGKLDIAYPNMLPQMEALKKLDDTFIYSSDTEKGNFYFMVSEDGSHAWNWVNQYIYNILPDLF